MPKVERRGHRQGDSMTDFYVSHWSCHTLQKGQTKRFIFFNLRQNQAKARGSRTQNVLLFILILLREMLHNIEVDYMWLPVALDGRALMEMEVTLAGTSSLLLLYSRPVHTLLLPPSTAQRPESAPARDTAPAEVTHSVYLTSKV